MINLIIIQARMNSTRLPGKVMMDLYRGQLVIDYVINACVQTGLPVCVATSVETADDVLAKHCDELWHNHLRMPVFRGPLEDVVERIYQCAFAVNADNIIRITGDCPFIDPHVILQVLKLHERSGADYTSNVDPATWPDGLDVQICTMKALATARLDAKKATDRETVVQYIVNNRSQFTISNLTCPIPHLEHERWVLDTQADFTFCREVASYFPDRDMIHYFEILDLLARKPEIKEINHRHHHRNERFLASKSVELPTIVPEAPATFRQPYGAGTYSKSHVALGLGGPLSLTYGDGAHVFDHTGNDYLDMIAGLGAVSIGHRDQQVARAIQYQMDRGIAFSLGTPIENELASRLSGVLKGEHNKVVFGKNGSDVCTAAARLARVVTGRNTILIHNTGYHGWHDWALDGTTRGEGCVPNLADGELHPYAEREDLHNFAAADATIDPAPAAIIIEPDQFSIDELHRLRAYCTEEKVLLIFDEMVTFGRYPHLTRAGHTNVWPDLMCVGKGLGNGMPITALIGPAELMDRFAPGDMPNAFYSATHFGETLSMAAAHTVLTILQSGGCAKTWGIAVELQKFLHRLTGGPEMHDKFFELGTPPLNRITFKTPDIANKFRCEMAHHGVLFYGAFNIMTNHTTTDTKRLHYALSETVTRIVTGKARSWKLKPSGVMRR